MDEQIKIGISLFDNVRKHYYMDEKGEIKIIRESLYLMNEENINIYSGD
jgi:hypothetical protein